MKIKMVPRFQTRAMTRLARSSTRKSTRSCFFQWNFGWFLWILQAGAFRSRQGRHTFQVPVWHSLTDGSISKTSKPHGVDVRAFLVSFLEHLMMKLLVQCPGKNMKLLINRTNWTNVESFSLVFFNELLYLNIMSLKDSPKVHTLTCLSELE